MLFGEPRMTNDMDVVVELNPSDVPRLAQAFDGEAHYCRPPEVIAEEINRRGQSTVLHIDSGSKVDFIIRKDTPFACREFSRRRRLPFSARLEAWSACPEDVVLAQLAAFRMSAQEKHIADIRGILRVTGEQLDDDYLKNRIERLDLQNSWAAVRRAEDWDSSP